MVSELDRMDFDHPALAELGQVPRLVPVAGELLRQANRADDRASFLEAGLPKLIEVAGADFGAVVLGHAGRWETLGQAGTAQSLPVDLLADALDAQAARNQGGWAVGPLYPRAQPAEALVLHAPSLAPDDVRPAAEALGLLLGECLDAIGQRQQRLLHDQRRLRRLEAIVEIAQRWNQNREMHSLLADMAQAATRLLDADRASIFLWDRASRTLVGRPALGVDGGELRVPDNAGVVGRVLKSGAPCRADASVEPELIDQKTDAKTGYQTRTLLCVPLRGSAGELFGAFELINKNIGSFTAEDEAALTELAAHAAVALENAQDRQQLLSTNRQIADAAAGEVRLIGQSPAIEALRSIIRRVADTDLAVLILGENGTGKEVVAQSIHYLSRRRDKPFVAVNCAAIPDTLAESELFGHEKGAFTDAQETRLGKFELAAEGTLFLDEIGDLSLGGQAKLLRVLEEKVLVRVGGSTPLSTDARVVAATNQNLAEMVREKRFRQDLFFRLNVVVVDLPPLRDRAEDVMLLAEHFLNDFCHKARRGVPSFSAAAVRRMESHRWPGNVRELRNLMERLAYLSTENQIEAEDLAFILSPRGQTVADLPLADGDPTLAGATAEFQVRHITQAIDRAGGNVSQAATQLGLHRSNLYRKMRQLGMDTP
ncbi:MAG: sigma-54-dependent Fis family transcriptional regulator [Pirellulales bacterium]|nr:sigma-54-dependent Fis family transcriptional regulator [Pirellulales bacterium]